MWSQMKSFETVKSEVRCFPLDYGAPVMISSNSARSTCTTIMYQRVKGKNRSHEYKATHDWLHKEDAHIRANERQFEPSSLEFLNISICGSPLFRPRFFSAPIPFESPYVIWTNNIHLIKSGRRRRKIRHRFFLRYSYCWSERHSFSLYLIVLSSTCHLRRAGRKDAQNISISLLLAF